MHAILLFFGGLEVSSDHSSVRLNGVKFMLRPKTTNQNFATAIASSIALLRSPAEQLTGPRELAVKCPIVWPAFPINF